MGEALDELKAAIGRLDYDRMQAALRQVEEMELDAYLSEEALQKAVQAFNFLGERREATNDLTESIDSFNLERLMEALAEAREYQAEDDVLHQGEARVAELQRLRAAAVAELTAAVTTREVRRVSQAIIEADRLDAVDSSVMNGARDRLQFLVQMDGARQNLLSGIEGDDLEELTHPPAARHFWPSGSRLDVFQDSRVRIPSSELLFFQKSALQQPGGLIKINLQCWDCSWMVCLKLRKNSDLGEFGQEGEFCGNWEIRGEKKFRSFQGIYIPCFFCNSRSSFQRVLTPSIMVWTNWISE